MPLSEYEMAREMVEKLGLNGVHVKFASTDGDGRGANGSAETFREESSLMPEKPIQQRHVWPKNHS